MPIAIHFRPSSCDVCWHLKIFSFFETTIVILPKFYRREERNISNGAIFKNLFHNWAFSRQTKHIVIMSKEASTKAVKCPQGKGQGQGF